MNPGDWTPSSVTRLLLRSALLVTLGTGMIPAHAFAQGGPPLITDDPDTPGPGHWEINLAALLDRGGLVRRLDAPRLDVNYGVGRRVQLKLEVPWVSLRDEKNRIQSGMGNAVTGLKWRFIGQEGM